MEALDFQLDDLRVAGCARFGSSEDESGGDDGLGFGSGDKFTQTCIALVGCLRHYDARIKELPSSTSRVTATEVYEAVRVRDPHFAVDATDIEFRLVQFLCTNLQAERIRKHASRGDSRREAAASTGKTVFQLEKICNDLEADTSSVNITSALDVLRLVTNKVMHSSAAAPAGLLEDPPRVLSHIDGAQLSKEQIDMTNSINQALQTDFLLRRRMLMKRLDVTIQSFLWGEKAQGKEGEVVAAIQAQRQHLSEQPMHYSIDDALQAPISLLHEHSKRVTDTTTRGGAGKKNLVKTVIIGHIPDRGGRANEMRPKKSDMGFGGGGGGGGGRGGREGGGGGGGRGGGGGGGGRGGREGGKGGGGKE